MLANFRGGSRAPLINLLMTFNQITNLVGSVQWCKIRTMRPEGVGGAWLQGDPVSLASVTVTVKERSWRHGERLGFL